MVDPVGRLDLSLWTGPDNSPVAPLRVYLDTNKWIDLAKASVGKADGKRYADVLEIARYGKKAGLVVFPLSTSHYFEVLRIRSAKRRRHLAPVMAELSGLTTMISVPGTLEGEIDRALRARWGRPLNIREAAIFGHGAGHAFSQKAIAYRVPDEAKVDEETRRRLELANSEALEVGLLAGPAADLPHADIDPAATDAVQDRHAQEEADLGALIRRSGRQGGDFRHIWEARALIELVEPINEAMLRAGLSPALFPALGQEGIEAFFAELPSSYALFELRWRRHRDPNLPWTRRDLNDLYGMSMAVVHCDVVVTERHMAGLLREAKLDARHETTVLTDLADLAPVLVAPAV